jgi:hypothetical protein
MEDLLDKIRFSLDVGWYGLQHVLSGHLFQLIAAVGLIILLWMMISPTVKNRR